jgi:hypothetical protein
VVDFGQSWNLDLQSVYLHTDPEGGRDMKRAHDGEVMIIAYLFHLLECRLGDLHNWSGSGISKFLPLPRIKSWSSSPYPVTVLTKLWRLLCITLHIFPDQLLYAVGQNVGYFAKFLLLSF